MSSQTLTIARGDKYRERTAITAGSKFITYVMLTLVIIEAMAIFMPSIVVNAPTTKAQTVSQTTTSSDSNDVIVFISVPVIEDAVNNDAIKLAVEEEMREQEILEMQIGEELAEEARLAELAKQQAYIDSIVCDPTDISRISGLRAEDFKYLTEGTWWSGHEDTLYQLEQTYGINAMFAMSVSTLESGCGTSYRATNKHNYYGIELASKSWDSLSSNTLWWGDMMQRLYVTKDVKSVWNIGPIYCPPNREWEVYMNDHMNDLYVGLINNLQDTLQ
ncbi:MAG: glucosaminidase domain-containing protein [Lachnospiraceae bacterium]|nr:glucosaminidase domain-containing protein [Lachnospiraceae bacterium]